MMQTQFFVRMHGDLAEHLPDFLEQMGMRRCGRLDDDWDQQFGRAELRSREQGWVKLGLWRDEADEWSINLIYENDPLPANEAQELHRKVLDAAAAAGMTITAQSGMTVPKSSPVQRFRYFVTADVATGQPDPLFVVRVDDRGWVQVYSLAGPGWVDAPNQDIRADVVGERGWVALPDGEVPAMLDRLRVGPGFWLTVGRGEGEPMLLVRSLDGRTLEGYAVSSGRWESMGYPPNPSLNDPARWQPVAENDVPRVQRMLHEAWERQQAGASEVVGSDSVDVALTGAAARQGIVYYVVEILTALPGGLVVGFWPPGAHSAGRCGSGPAGPGGARSFEVDYRVGGFAQGAEGQVFDAFKRLFDAWGWTVGFEDAAAGRRVDARTSSDDRHAYRVTVEARRNGDIAMRWATPYYPAPPAGGDDAEVSMPSAITKDGIQAGEPPG